jgi:hypothetical protein
MWSSDEASLQYALSYDEIKHCDWGKFYSLNHSQDKYTVSKIILI